MRKRLLNSYLALVACCSAALPLFVPGTPHAEAGVAYHQRLSFEQSNGGDPLPGLFLFEAGPEGLVERILVASPDGRRWVLTKSLLARPGVQIVTILDDESSEWVRLRTAFGFQSDSLQGFFTQAHELLVPEADHRVEMTLRTSRNGASFAAMVRAGFRIEGPGFVSALEDQGSAQGAAEAIPQSLYSARAFLLEALGDLEGQGLTFLVLLDVADGLAPHADGRLAAGASGKDRGPGGWHQRIVDRTRGLRIEDPVLTEFLEGFRHIDATTPLADHRLLAVVMDDR